ncbi:lipoxygenase family protein [Janthinobacterium fluminis]|uniref:Lipoxygenase family protein n=1 Tax=Janthinobacterium fluminis TaxID=2987524 RepID=A0ABT5JW16_9BURK|nr:lipoxygenase family protein [Janthinobacterium fluminis]MDC8756922.1 lipoxygenase family protein [Janthinobacterium fluminis]
MTSNKVVPLTAVPASVLAYTAGVTNPCRSRHATAGALPVFIKSDKAMASDMQVQAEFVFSGLTATDLSYDSSQYPVTGSFAATLPPWLNDLAAVPADWQVTAVDTANSAARTVQVDKAMAYIAKNVPGQQYNGTSTAQIISQWYTQGMWSSDSTVFSPVQIATLTSNWIADDAELARQRLGGANPNVIKQAPAASYNIASWIGKAANGASLSALQSKLGAAQSAGALFVCDYTGVLGAAVTKQYVRNGRFLAAPLCFFTIDGASNALMPQAIQINATDGSSYIFTPGDSNDAQGDAWLLAKLWVASADQQWWFSGSHLFNTHTVDMLFGTAALNQIQAGTLPASHALVVLAKPFLNKSFNINSGVIGMPGSNQAGIYQKNSFCDEVLPTGRIGLYQVINSLYQNYRFDDNAFPAQMAQRGLSGGAIGKVSFPYRDDGQVWWDAIATFVGQIVDASYPNDAAVAADAGLNGWMGAAQAAFNHDGTTRFTWTPSVSYLKSAFSNLLYTCSVQHTSVNNSMFNGWAFTPNGAFAMQAAPPANAAAVTRQTVLASLPNPQNTAALANVIQSQISFVMNGTAEVAQTLGVSSSGVETMYALYPYAQGSARRAAVGAFWNAVWSSSTSVSARIAANQNARIKSWTGNTPVPNSVSYQYLSAELNAWTAPQYLNAAATNAIQI